MLALYTLDAKKPQAKYFAEKGKPGSIHFTSTALLR